MTSLFVREQFKTVKIEIKSSIYPSAVNIMHAKKLSLRSENKSNQKQTTSKAV